MLAALAKRLGRYGLTLHKTKTRFVDFRFKRPRGRHPTTVGTTFDFLGFTHVWGKSRRGKDVVRQITAKGRYSTAWVTASSRLEGKTDTALAWASDFDRDFAHSPL